MLRYFLLTVTAAALQFCSLAAQPPAASKPTEHILGSITALQPDEHSITVHDDKSSQVYVISLAATRTLLKVAPGAKDLTQAARITSGDLAVGDRVDVRGFPGDAANAIQARSLVLMSGRDLAARQESEAQAWHQSSVGKVTSVDPAATSLQIDLRTPDGTKSTVVQMTPATEFLRYDPKTPKTPSLSNIASLQVGDQVHIIGAPGADGSSLAASKIYSAPVRTVSGTIVQISTAPPVLSIKDAQKQTTVVVTLTEATTLKKLPAEMAAAMQTRVAGSESGAAHASPASAPAGPRDAAAAPAQRPRRDLSKLLDRLPAEALSDLKTGDAVIISGFAAEKPGDVIAATIVSGVEPLLQQQQARQASRAGPSSDWGLEAPMPQ